jgi:formamidopyrimidine-DNA glycosylase
MPELPYVEATRKYLMSEDIIGSKITSFDIFWPYAIKTPTTLANIVNREIKRITRYGKFLILELDDWNLVFHLRMSGQLTISNRETSYTKHVRNVFQIGKDLSLWFIDQRKFGEIWITRDLSIFFAKLGPEPLGKDFTIDWLTNASINRNIPVKTLLLNQNIVAGIGNIFADEILFSANIIPTRKTSELSIAEYDKLHRSVITIIAEATERMINTIPLPKPDKKSGDFISMLHIPREMGSYCYICSSRIQRILISQRSSYFCPTCQS